MYKAQYKIILLVVSVLLLFFDLAEGKNQDNYSFTNISIKEGLSNNHVTCVLEDSRGFLWFATSEGLNRWDGFQLKLFRNDPVNKNSLPGNFILYLEEDSSGNLWIGTNQDGLSKYDLSTEQFHNYEPQPGDETSIPGSVVRSIYTDTQHNVWIGTNNGLAKYLPGQDQFKPYLIPINGASQASDIRALFQIGDKELCIQTNLGLFSMDLSNEEITLIHKRWPTQVSELLDQNDPILIDSGGNLWIGSPNGLHKFNSQTLNHHVYLHHEDDPSSVSSQRISRIFEDSRGSIWIGTENNGLNLYNSEEDNFTVLKSNKLQSSSISNNIITDIFEDSYGNIWFATQEGGVNFISTSGKFFEHHTHDPFNDKSLSNSKVGAFCEDKQGMIWIGTGDGGVNRFNPETNLFEHRKIETAVISPSVLGIAVNPVKENSLLVTGWGLGLYEMNTTDFKLKNLFAPDNQGIFSTWGNIKGMGIDSEQNVWLATHDYEGVVVYNIPEGKFYDNQNPGKYNPEFLNARYAVSMVEDHKKRKWMISYVGLEMYDGSFHSFRSVKNDTATLSTNYLYTVFEDTKGCIWVGGSDGLDRMVERGDTILFERLSNKYGIPINIKSILEDDEGNLWLSSNQGISTFNPEQNQVKHIFGSKEIQDMEFIERSCLKTTNGELYFGGTNGFVHFNPETLSRIETPYNLYLVDLKIFNESQKVNAPGSPLSRSILETDEVELTHRQSVLEFEYVALCFNENKAFEYAYTLEGYDKKWNFAGAGRVASYTNLAPGEYTFRVKTSEGYTLSQDDGIALSIKIRPPFWKTKLAYVVYLLLVSLILYLFRRSIIYRENLRNELKMEKMSSQSIKMANLMKLRFFTNISHEFKTPLTLIQAPVEKLLDDETLKHSEEQKFQLGLIQKNADKLLRMVNQLMDYRKLEAGSLVLETSKGDIISFIKKVWTLFNELATQRKIQFEFRSGIERLLMSFDPDKLDKIISNVLSNAIKNTDECGYIGLTVTKLDEILQISIRDTGVGIPEKNLPYIFDRFYSVNTTGDTRLEGTGIGLTLAKELTELHGGKIAVNSVLGEGTEITITLPISKELESHSDKVEHQVENDEKTRLDVAHQQIENSLFLKPSKARKPKVLVVEDDPDLRLFIQRELADVYEVITAKNGEDGLRKAFFKYPDIIISDVMMPVMDGLEFCSIIKNDERTSHTPVILLTARYSEDKHREGFEVGADDYIYKPFNLTLLKSRIENLLLRRSKLIENFQKSTNLYFDHEDVDDGNQLMMQSIIDIVLENISEEKINAEFISKRVHISRSLLYLKIEAISGQTVNEFIRSIRLKKAAQLLLQKKMSVTEIAYAVGFSSQPYFTRCFSKMFDVSPSRYTG